MKQNRMRIIRRYLKMDIIKLVWRVALEQKSFGCLVLADLLTTIYNDATDGQSTTIVRPT